MGTISARKCRSIIENVEAVLAIELLCGCQAVDLLTVGQARARNARRLPCLPREDSAAGPRP